MPHLRLKNGLYLCLLWLGPVSMFGADHHGEVRFSRQPVPGAVITASQGQKLAATFTDRKGTYIFLGLADGLWHMKVEMPGFLSIEREVSVSSTAPNEVWDLTMLPLSLIVKDASAVPYAPVSPSSSGPTSADRQSHDSTGGTVDDDSLLINGTVNNGASTLVGQSRALGNNRNGIHAMYNGNIGVIVDNSIFDARAYSLSGLNSPKPDYNHFTSLASFGGPLRIPHLLWQNGPTFTLSYQGTRDHNANVQAGLVPTMQERAGDLSGADHPTVLDPNTHRPFPGNRVPVSSQAQALLNLYPLPNSSTDARYNYQTPTVASDHQDSWQLRLIQKSGKRDQIYGVFAGQSIRADNTNLFGFIDTTNSLGLNTAITWQHLYTSRLSTTLGYQYSRLALRAKPYFADRTNVSGLTGIRGNDQDPSDWGPPALNFAGGIAGLSDIQASFTRNQTNGVSYSALWNHYRHNFRVGGDFRRQQFNLLSQQNSRGSFAFTGAATGYDLADYLLGIPDTSSIAFGNADKYFRASVYDAFIADDFRVAPGFTLNAGLRWDYGSPITEKYDRLVNLDVAAGYAAIAPLLGSNPKGALTGDHYPRSLIRPDRIDIEPRIGIAWRPLPDASLVIRAGYGIYYNTAVYFPVAAAMAQQFPLSKSFSIQNSISYPLTLANGFDPPSNAIADTYAVDPNLRVGYAQNWNLSVQSDLPWSTTLIGSYLGIKGTHGQQQFLPNTFPAGATNRCLSCPTGFLYLSSGGNSTREAGQLQFRRRLHNGFTASVQYTYSKAMDDSSLGGGTGQSGVVIAQNWLDLGAERGPSSFDQRHLLDLSVQYTSGMGRGGITALQGWHGALLREWTLLTHISAGTGLPETPIYFAAVPGTGITGSLRPDYTGASNTTASAGFFLNPAAYKAPTKGQWGNAGRNSIVGPSQFTWDSSVGRVFRLRDVTSLDFRIDSMNLLNHVNFTSWNTVTNSSQFGLPSAANAMRNVQTTLRFRF